MKDDSKKDEYLINAPPQIVSDCFKFRSFFFIVRKIFGQNPSIFFHEAVQINGDNEICSAKNLKDSKNIF